MTDLHDKARALLALREKATPGPWGWHGDELLSSEFILATNKASRPKEPNARLIAAAHDMADTIADLLAENERLVIEAEQAVQSMIVWNERALSYEARLSDLCNQEPVAWSLTRQRDGFVRGCLITKPAHDDLQLAVLEGDQYLPLIPRPSMEKKS